MNSAKVRYEGIGKIQSISLKNRFQMYRNLILTLVVMLQTLFIVPIAIADMDCSQLDPRAFVSAEKEGKVEASVNTLYKIAKTSGSIEGKIKEEIHTVQNGASASEQGLIKLRTLYLFCGMVAKAKDISAERKVDLFQIVMNINRADKPVQGKAFKRKEAVNTDPAIATVPTGPAKDNELVQKINGETSTINGTVSSYGQSGGITAQTVVVMLPKATDAKPTLFAMNNPQLILVRKYLIPKHIGAVWSVGDNCPSAPCFVIKLAAIDLVKSPPSVTFGVGGTWDKINAPNFPNVFGLHTTLKEGCGSRFSTGYYDLVFEIISDRATALEAWVAIFDGTEEKGTTKIRRLCP